MEWYSLLVTLVTILPASYSSSPADENVSYRNNILYYVEGSADAIGNLSDYAYNTLNITYTSGNGTYLYLVVPPKPVRDLEVYIKGHNLKETIVSTDYQAYVDAEKAVPGSPFSWTAYYDIDDIFAHLENVSLSHPKWTKMVNAGQSYEKRDIFGLRINTGCVDKPAFFLESGIHAREWVVPAIATYFINQLLSSNDPKIIAMRDQFDWHIFPLVNPDGYHYSYTRDRFWRKNRSVSPSGCHGVDLNRNWDTENWGEFSASNDSCDLYIYTGPKPFSEPETRSLSQYVANITNLQVYTSMHSDFQMLLLPYSGSDEHVDNYDDEKKIGNLSLTYGFKVNGAIYTGPGPAGEISYKSSGESIDWAKRTLKVPLAFEYELRGDLFDWPPSKIYQQGDEFTQMMLGLVTEANDLGYFNKFQKCTDSNCFCESCDYCKK